MAKPNTTRGGKLRVLLDIGRTGNYASPCGLQSKTLTITKGMEEFSLDDCDDIDDIPWLGRDATNLSMGISGEGVSAEQSVETWLEAVESPVSVPAMVELEFPSKTITWTGDMHVSTFTAGAPTKTGRVTSTVEMASDGKMVRAVA